MIALVVTRGYGNGTYSGTVPNVTVRGYLLVVVTTHFRGFLVNVGRLMR